MRTTIAAVGLAMGVASTPVLAQGLNQDSLYVGGGLGLNSVSGWDNALGFQIFAGYELDMVNVDPIKLAVEIGYMDTGDFDRRGWYSFSASGLWATAVGSYALTPEFSVLARLGLDFGDDDGLMLGGGVGYLVTPQIEVRGEYVIRDHVDSLQANVVYHF